MRFRFVTQVYPPDPAAVGLHMAEAAEELVRRGHEVVVLTSNRGYDDPSTRFPTRERRNGVDVRRLPLTSFGKQGMVRRVTGAGSFMLQAFGRVLAGRPADLVLYSTTPPLVGVLTAAGARLRRCPTAYWVMDLNPDQLVALGRLRRTSAAARALEMGSRFALRHSRRVIVLDSFMEARLRRKSAGIAAMDVVPPWAMGGVDARPLRDAGNRFRRVHALDDRLVVMYSGNHSPSNPLTTVLEAARRLKHDPRVAFVFVGGGIGKDEVERYRDDHGLGNILSLPYQPLDKLSDSLAAADVHVVTLGDEMVGIVHPSKIYGAMAIGRPILFVGPMPSHISDIMQRAEIGWACRHGDVSGVVGAIEAVLDAGPAVLRRMGERAAELSGREFDPADLRRRLCDILEETAALPVASRRSLPAAACSR